jgi:hypothetical protein
MVSLSIFAKNSSFIKLKSQIKRDKTYKKDKMPILTTIKVWEVHNLRLTINFSKACKTLQQSSSTAVQIKKKLRMQKPNNNSRYETRCCQEAISLQSWLRKFCS